MNPPRSQAATASVFLALLHVVTVSAQDVRPEPRTLERGACEDRRSGSNAELLREARQGPARLTADVTASHTLSLRDRTLEFRATAGRIVMENAQGVADAEIAFMAFTRRALALDGTLEVAVVHGPTDLITPYFRSKLLLDQFPPIGRADRLQLIAYPGGHMFYAREASRRQFRRDIAAMVGRVLATRRDMVSVGRPLGRASMLTIEEIGRTATQIRQYRNDILFIDPPEATFGKIVAMYPCLGQEERRMLQSAVVEDELDEPRLRLRVSLADGARFEPPAAAGFRVMELIRAHGFPIKAECGGACVCATCHVRVPKHWQGFLPPPTDEELARLDEIPTADASSRLACQLVMTDDLDGLEVEVQPDSFVPQTYWVAG